MKKKREGITPTVRFNVFKRDRFTCQYCGQSPPAVILELDHVIPVAEGGDDSSANLTTACFDCNRGKGARQLSDIPETVAERMAKQMELRKQLEAYNKFLASSRKSISDAANRIGKYWCDKSAPDQEQGKWTLSDDYTKSVMLFLKSLPEIEILEAVDIAHSRYPNYSHLQTNGRTWKYFCGICWRKIKGDRQDA